MRLGGSTTSVRFRAVAVLLAAALGLAACGTDTSGTGAAAGQSAAPGQPGQGGGSTAQYTPTGAYTLAGGSATKTGAITASTQDQSGVLVTGGSLTLSGARVTTTGASSSSDESSFYGLNAGVLANGGAIAMNGGSVTTSGDGANGVFAYGKAVVTLAGTAIAATGQYAHGIMASGGGTITATDVTVTTTGGSSAPIATDRGGGTITVKGGSYRSSGANSPAIYSTGAITATGGVYAATGSEVVVIEGANSVTLTGAALTASKAGKWGVMIYQSMSGDAAGSKGTYTQTGGSLTETAADSPLFYVTNTTGVITLSGVKLTTAGGILVKAAAGQWGTAGSNGGTVQLTASGQSLSGDVVADASSSVAISLAKGSTLVGAVDAAGTAKAATLTLDGSSAWTVTADSHLTVLSGAVVSGGTITNITGNGHTVTYDAGDSANTYLGGRTYTLTGGGTLAAA
jgi:hypothetical protein